MCKWNMVNYWVVTFINKQKKNWHTEGIMELTRTVRREIWLWFPFCKFQTHIGDWYLGYSNKHYADAKSTLVQAMACCRQIVSNYIHQCWPQFPKQYGVSRSEIIVRFNGTYYGKYGCYVFTHWFLWNSVWLLYCLCNLSHKAEYFNVGG